MTLKSTPGSADLLSRLAELFEALPAELRKAARYVSENPSDVAFRSMRSAAGAAQVSPATMVRLTRALGLNRYDELRAAFQAELDRRPPSFLARARELRAQSKSRWTNAVHQAIDSELASLHECVSHLSDEALEQVASLFVKARRIYVIGFRGMYPAAFNFHYATSMFSERVVLVDGAGGTYIDALRGIGASDVALVFTCRPYPRVVATLLKLSRDRGAKLVSVTDGPFSPAARAADVLLTVHPTASSLPSSSSDNVLVSRILASLFLAASGRTSVEAIRNTDEHLAAFRIYADD